MTALVSVIIPAYNGAAFLPEAVASVRAQDLPVDLIVVDDGSTDDTAAVAAALAVRLVQRPNGGVGAARNSGLAAATCPFVAFLDVDDLWPLGSVRRRLDYLETHPAADFVQGELTSVALHPELPTPTQYPLAVSRLFCLGTALFRREVFERVGLFDERGRMGEDLDWFLRAQEQGVQGGSLATPTLINRQHPGSLTYGKNGLEIQMTRILKQALDRRRKKEG